GHRTTPANACQGASAQSAAPERAPRRKPRRLLLTTPRSFILQVCTGAGARDTARPDICCIRAAARAAAARAWSVAPGQGHAEGPRTDHAVAGAEDLRGRTGDAAFVGEVGAVEGHVGLS